MKQSLVGRLMLAYTAVIAAVLLSAWWSQRSLGEAEWAAQHLAERSVEGIDLSAKLETLLEEKSRIADYLLSGNGEALAAIRPHREQFQTWMTEMQDFVRTDEERQLLDRMRAGYASFTSKADAVIQLAESQRSSEARSLFVAMASDVEQLVADSRQLSTLAARDMSDRRAQAATLIDRDRALVLWLTGLGGLLSLILGFVLSRYAARPIYQLVLRLGSSGVIDRVEVDGDELGALEAHVGALLARVRQQERALQQAEKLSEMGEIASEIAHETLNPLAGVKGMLQALRRAPLPADRLPRELADMERELARIEGIVRRLVYYARPLEPRMRRAAVESVLHRAAETARRTPAAINRSIHVEATPRDLQWVMDPDLIQQVLVNLLVNGCEASPAGARVEVHADTENGRLALRVRDRGKGIVGTTRDRLFHPFFTTKPHGNGLGLAVSRNIVREHGGQIEATPGVGGGSVFTVLLPRGETLCVARS